MPEASPQLVLNIIAAIAAFGFFGGAWLAVLLVVSIRQSARRRAMEERLGLNKAETAGEGRTLRLWHEGQLMTTTVPKMTEPSTWLVRLRRLHDDAGVRAGFASMVLGLVGAMLLAGVIAWATTKHPIVAAGAPAFIFALFLWQLRRRASRREAVFENQFIDALGLAARSLRAGHPLLGAFQLIADELSDPVKSIFASICQQHAMGVRLDEAIQRVAATSASTDVHLFATAVSIQLRSGGNLAQVMEGLSEVIRDRIRVARRAKILTAQTQFSKRILIALPLVLFFMLNLVNPEYMALLYTTSTGRMMLLGGAISLVMGIFLMNRIAVVRY